MRALAVVAGVIEDPRGNILLGQRPAHKAEPLKWEFPGGKVHPGEGLANALKRELREELSATFDIREKFATVRWRDLPGAMNLHGFRCETDDPITISSAHTQLAWYALDQLVKADVPAPDRPFVARLALPTTYFITPPPEIGGQRYVDGVARSLDQHRPGAVLVRLPGIDRAELTALAVKILKCIRARGSTLALLHNQPLLSQALGFDGVHLSSQRLLMAPKRSIAMDHWLFASCHTGAEIEHAQFYGVDAAVYGPVKATASHPGRNGIGWQAFSRQTRATYLPVYALGGVSPVDLSMARAHGAHGIAGISAFGLPANAD